MKKYILTLIILAAVLLAAIPTAQAATYYVDFQNGNDASDGLSKASAWKTIPGTCKNNGIWGDYLRPSWGGNTVDASHKIPPGTIIKLRPGTTYDTSLGGFIWINKGFYLDTATSDMPIRFELDETWGSGAVVFDATGLNLNTLLSLIHI